MVSATYEILSIRFDFKADWTEVEVVCGPASDGMLGVQGSHKKVFQKDRDALSLLENEIARGEFLLW